MGFLLAQQPLHGSPARLAAQSYLGAAYEFQQYDDHTTSE